MGYVNTSISDNQSEDSNVVIDENLEGIVTFLCDEDIQELQTRKLTVLTTISVLTLLSNMAILLAILSRQGKVIECNYIILDKSYKNSRLVNQLMDWLKNTARNSILLIHYTNIRFVVHTYLIYDFNIE